MAFFSSCSEDDSSQLVLGPVEPVAGCSTAAPATTHVLPPGGRFVAVPQSIREFASKMECPVYQINAQRFFGPPTAVLKNWAPEGESEVFIGRLPREIMEPELVPWLEQIGPIFQLRLMMDFSGSNKGFCFVKYYTEEQANLAVEVLNKKRLHEQTVVVAKSVDNKRLVLNGVSTDTTEDYVRQVVQSMAEGVVDIEISWEVDDGKPVNQEGVVLVTYQTHRDAAIARKKMLHKPFFMGNHQMVFADWAECGPGIRALKKYVSGNPNNILVVNGLPQNTRLQTMWQTFKSLGPFCGVDYIQMAGRKDKAFVFFRKRAQAEVAKLAFDGSEIQGRRVRVGWCDPDGVPKKFQPKKERAPFSQQEACQEPSNFGPGGEMVGFENQTIQQQVWYPYPQQMVVPQMQMMMTPQPPPSGPMSYYSSGGAPSQEWGASQGGSSAELPLPSSSSQVYYQHQPYQQISEYQAAPSGGSQEAVQDFIPSGTVYYFPMTLATEHGYQHGYQQVVWDNRTEEGAAAAAYPSPPCSYPGYYWTHYTPLDYYQEVVEQEENRVIEEEANHQGLEIRGEEEPPVGEEVVEEEVPGQGQMEEAQQEAEQELQQPRLDLYNTSVWMSN